MERKLKLIGKKVLLRHVYSMETKNGMVTESYNNIEGILEKLGPNNFFGWEVCATINGRMYKIENLSQIVPIYK